MSLDLPDTASEIDQRAKTDVQRELPESNPFLQNSWLGALITGYANRIFDFYLQLRIASLNGIPDTATGSFLERWAAIWGIFRLAASVSRGNTVATGLAGALIPAGTAFSSSDGKIYTSTELRTIILAVVNVASITRVGNVATVITGSDHNLASNIPATITGADQVEYNVTSEPIQVTGLDSFTFTVGGAPVTPATGVIIGSFTYANVPVQSDGFGNDQNQDADAPLTLQSPIVDVDDESKVDFGALGGGTDQEIDTSLRVRLLGRIQSPIAHFNVSEITAKAKEIPGVTRVFVQPITPLVGQVTVYFMRDNDANPIPTASEVTTVKNKLLEITPVNTDPSDLIVAAPVAVPVNFTFTGLTPNTVTMQSAISTNLQQFFDERVDVEVGIDQDAYRSAIFNTVDTNTGGVLQTFTLSAPVGDIAITTGEIGVLGNVVYP